MTVQQPVPSAPPVKAPFWYRYRAGVGALLLVNLGIGGYVLSRPRSGNHAHHTHHLEKHKSAEAEKENAAPAQVSVTVESPAPAAVAAAEWTAPPKKIISEEEQRQVLQWVLDEKRKVKGLSKAEKAKIDEEKRLLKQFLRGSELPPLV